MPRVTELLNSKSLLGVRLQVVPRVLEPQVFTRGTTPNRAPSYSTPSPAPSILSTKKRGYQQVFHLINSLCKEKNILKL